MTQPLLSATDFAQFQAKDPNWFLGAAGETIRAYCGWHIYPVETVTGVEARIGNAGIIMLPTLNLLSVEQIMFNGTTVPATDYEIHDSGWIDWLRWMPYRNRSRYVTVDFTHGYDTLPRTVAEVGYELTGRTLEKPAGVVKHITRGPTDIDFNEFGSVLSDDQKNRLAPYTLLRV